MSRSYCQSISNIIFGDWIEFVTGEPFDFFYKHWQQRDNGQGIFKLRIGYKSLYVISGKKYVDEVLHSKAGRGYNFIRGEGFNMVREIFGSYNIGTMEDEPYKEKRGLIHRHFGQPQLQDYSQHFERIISDWLTDLPGTTVNLSKEVSRLSCNITGAIFVHQDQSSTKIKEASHHLGRLISLMNRTAFTPYPMWFKRAYDKVVASCPYRVPFLPEALQPAVWNAQRDCREKYYAALERFIDLVIEEKAKEGTETSTATSISNFEETLFTDLYERYRDRIVDGVYPEEFKSDIAAIFFAGQDTTTSLIMWLMIELERHPNIRSELIAQIDEKFKGEKPTLDEVYKFSYLIAIVMETLRLDTPSAGTIRNLRIEDNTMTGVQIGPHTLQDGDHVFVYNYIVNRDEQCWGTDADKWRPQRMLDFHNKFGKWPTEERSASFTTFIDGQHKCPGRRIAVPVAAYFLILFLQRFDYHINTNCDLSPKIEIVTLPKDDVEITLIPR